MKARNPSELWKNKLQSMMEKSSDICSRNKKIYFNVLLHECDPPILPHTHTHIHPQYIMPGSNSAYNSPGVILKRDLLQNDKLSWKNYNSFLVICTPQKRSSYSDSQWPFDSGQQPAASSHPPAKCTSQKAWIRPRALMRVLYFILKFENTTKFPRSSKEKSETK